jgi:hypothetical protein
MFLSNFLHFLQSFLIFSVRSDSAMAKGGAGGGEKREKREKKSKSAMSEVVTREYTINMHKRIHGMWGNIFFGKIFLADSSDALHVPSRKCASLPNSKWAPRM